MAAVVYVLWHHYPDEPDDDNAKLLGVYSSHAKCEERIESFYTTLPGFSEGKGQFTIDEYPVDEDQWTSGFFRAGEDN
jgi:hypothetical protein